MKQKVPLKYSVLLAGPPRREASRDSILKAGGNCASYDRLCVAYDREFHPMGILQERLVQELVDIRWRLDHVRVYARRCGKSPKQLSRASLQSLREMIRYERRLLKQYDEIFSDVLKYQRDSKAA